MARLPPVAEQEWTDRARQAISPTIRSVAVMMGDDDISRPEHQKPLNILLTLAHNDQLIGPFLQWAAALAVDGALDRRDAELLALRLEQEAIQKRNRPASKAWRDASKTLRALFAENARRYPPKVPS